MFTFEFDHFDSLSQFCTKCRETSKLVNFQDFTLKNQCFPQYIKMWSNCGNTVDNMWKSLFHNFVNFHSISNMWKLLICGDTVEYLWKYCGMKLWGNYGESVEIPLYKSPELREKLWNYCGILVSTEW